MSVSPDKASDWVILQSAYNKALPGVDKATMIQNFVNAPAYAVTHYGIGVDEVTAVWDKAVSMGFWGGYFLAYSQIEGGGAGGWINHYASDTGNGYMADAERDLAYLIDLANGDRVMPAWEDKSIPYASSQSVQDAGNVEYTTKIKVHMVGYFYIPATAATPWSLWDPDAPMVWNGGYYGDPVASWGTYFKNAGWNGKGTGGNGITLPVPQWPFDNDDFSGNLTFTQAPYETLFHDHSGFAGYDIAFSQNNVPYHAPVDIEVVGLDPSTYSVVWLSTSKVYFADGKTGYLGMVTAHDNTTYPTLNQKFKTGEIMGHTGTGGIATGDHVHMSAVILKDHTIPQWHSWGDSYGGWDIIGTTDGDHKDGVIGNVRPPTPFISSATATSSGQMTFNNVFSVTDDQKSVMVNGDGSDVNIDAFHFVDSGDAPDDEDTGTTPTTRKKSQNDIAGGIFNIFNT